MSFSAKVKGELGRYTEMSREEALAQISAMMKVSGTIAFNGKGLSFKITTENPTSARLVFTLLKEHFHIHSKLMVKKSNSLKKNNIYMVVIDEEMGVRELLKETGIFKEVDGGITLDYRIDEKMVETDDEKAKEQTAKEEKIKYEKTVVGTRKRKEASKKRRKIAGKNRAKNR